MSRVGRKPISIPAGVEVQCEDNLVTVKGAKGTLSQQFSKDLGIEIQEGQVIVTRPSDDRQYRSLHGLTRTLIANMIEGVTNGYSKTLIIEGVGYRAVKKGNQTEFILGYSHHIFVQDTDDVQLEIPQPNTVIVKGADKQKVGQVAAEIRKFKLTNPYTGQGIHYADEVVVRKEGKTGKGKK